MNRAQQLFYAILLLPGLAASVAGCGDGSSLDTPAAVLSGTVSSPNGIAEASVSLKSPDGEITSFETDQDGRFSSTDTLAADRYLMQIDLGNDNYMYSIAHLTQTQGNRQNIHSYTDLVARTWFADQGLDINSVFNSLAGIENFPSHELIESINTNVQAIVSDVLEVYGLASVNLSTADYDASDTGVDRFLNENPVMIKNNRATIIVNDPQTNMQSIAVNRVPLQTTFGAIDTSPPQQPQDARALGASESEIVLAWTIATDNIGVATYEIYRDDILIGHTPFPVYRDSELGTDVTYSYSIVTVDESGNRSTPSVNAIGNVLTEADNTAPDVPSTATLEATTDNIQVFWSYPDLSDLARFEVTRTGGEAILIREVTSASLSDLTVASGTEYCFTIVAVDASGNRSESNPVSCITTSGTSVDEPVTTEVLETIQMAQETISAREDTIVNAYVERLGNGNGEVSIDYVITPGTASSLEDYLAVEGTLVWSDQDLVAKQIEIRLLADGIKEDDETFSIVLTTSSVNAVITDAVTTVQIIDID